VVINNEKSCFTAQCGSQSCTLTLYVLWNIHSRNKYRQNVWNRQYIHSTTHKMIQLNC